MCRLEQLTAPSRLPGAHAGCRQRAAHGPPRLRAPLVRDSPEAASQRRRRAFIHSGGAQPCTTAARCWVTQRKARYTIQDSLWLEPFVLEREGAGGGGNRERSRPVSGQRIKASSRARRTNRRGIGAALNQTTQHILRLLFYCKTEMPRQGSRRQVDNKCSPCPGLSPERRLSAHCHSIRRSRKSFCEVELVRSNISVCPCCRGGVLDRQGFG